MTAGAVGDHAGLPGSDDAGEVFPPLTDEQTSLLSRYRQGDALPRLTQLPVAGTDGTPRVYDAPLGAVILSQTCDVVQPNRLAAQLAPRVRLTDTPAAEARAGRRPRYLHLPALGDEAFADLEVVATVAKAVVADQPHQAGATTDDDVRRLARAVARKFGRFPFPDDGTPWLTPLEDVLKSKAAKPASPEGQALEEVVQFRVEASGGWLMPPYDLTLVVIVTPGTLPTFPDDEPPELPAALDGWLRDDQGGLARSSAQIASRLLAATNPDQRYWLWHALVEAWANRCRPASGAAGDIRAAVRGSALAFELLSEDEYPLARVRRSEELDLDHLSPPTPT